MRSLVVDAASQPIVNLVRSSRPTAVLTGSGYGTQTLTAVTGIVAPNNTTTAMRVSVPAGATNNPGYLFDMRMPVVGETLYMSADVFVESGYTTGFGFAISSQASGVDQPLALEVGKWVRVSWSVKATTTNAVGFRFASRAAGNNPDGQSFLITNIMVESNSGVGHEFGDSGMTNWKALPDGTSVGYPLSFSRIAGADPIVDFRALTASTSVDTGFEGGNFTIGAVWTNSNNSATVAGKESYAKIQDAVSNGGIRFLLGNGTTWTANVLRGSGQGALKIAIMSVSPGTFWCVTHENNSVTANSTGPMIPYMGVFAGYGRAGTGEISNGPTHRAFFIPRTLTPPQLMMLRGYLAATHGTTIAP